MTLSTTSEVATPWLKSLGYEVHFRTATWTEVLITHAQEQWWGRGPSEDVALQQAMHGMFPSLASLHLFSAHLEKATPRPEVPSHTDLSAPAAQTQEPAVTQQQAHNEAADFTEVEEARDDSASSQSGLRERLVRTAELEARAAELLARVQVMQPELAVCSAEVQRAVLLEWIAACRHLQDGLGSRDSSAIGQVRAIIARVSATWWPGTMPALRRQASLSDAVNQLKELGLSITEQPTDWEHIERLAVQAREMLEARYTSEGRDPSGYRRAGGPQPAPSAVVARLAQAKEQLSRLKVQESDAKKIERTILSLRWIRTEVEEPLAWADAWGSLRKELLRHTGRAPEWLRPALRWMDPDNVPPRGFADALGINPEAMARRRRRKDLAEQLRQIGASDVASLTACLEQAAPDFTAEELRELLSTEQMVALRHLPDDHLKSRGARKKLRKLKEAAAASIEAPATIDASEADADLVAQEEASEPFPGEERLRATLRGKRCILVTNRPEHDLCTALAERTGMHVEFRENQSRKLDGVVESIRAGRVAVVLLVTSFIGHEVDAKIQDACRGTATKMLRVRKGKLRILMEELLRHVDVALTPANGHPAV